MASSISHSRIAPFGVEAKVDLTRTLGEEDKAELRRLYALEGLLVVRGLDISAEQQAEFCRIFGPVPDTSHDMYIISNVEKDGLFADLELLFHHDIPYVPEPFIAGCLYGVEVSPGVSPTRFASGFLAYERMPQKLRARIDGMNALFVRPRLEERRCLITDAMPGDNCAVQAMVQRQQGTGRPYVFVNAHSTALVAGLSQSESDELLEELYSHIYTPDNIYEHHWTTGDLVLWDNRGLQHARAKVSGGVRTLRRVTVARLSYDQQYPAHSAWFNKLQEGILSGDEGIAA